MNWTCDRSVAFSAEMTWLASPGAPGCTIGGGASPPPAGRTDAVRHDGPTETTRSSAAIGCFEVGKSYRIHISPSVRLRIDAGRNFSSGRGPTSRPGGHTGGPRVRTFAILSLALAAWTDPSSHARFSWASTTTSLSESSTARSKHLQRPCHNLYTGLDTSEGTTHWTST